MPMILLGSVATVSVRVVTFKKFTRNLLISLTVTEF